MGTAFEKLRQNYPQVKNWPGELEGLFEYSDNHGGKIVTDFEVSGELKAETISWFQDHKDIAGKFIMFAQDSIGGLYGFWIYNEGRRIDNAPIAYLDPEGCGNTVLADNMEEFLCILASGKKNIGRIDTWPDYPIKKDVNFNNWLQRNMLILPDENPKRIVEEARSGHPSLEEWVIDWMGSIS